MTLRQKVLITYKAKKFRLISDILIVIYIERKKKGNIFNKSEGNIVLEKLPSWVAELSLGIYSQISARRVSRTKETVCVKDRKKTTWNFQDLQIVQCDWSLCHVKWKD